MKKKINYLEAFLKRVRKKGTLIELRDSSNHVIAWRVTDLNDCILHQVSHKEKLQLWINDRKTRIGLITTNGGDIEIYDVNSPDYFRKDLEEEIFNKAPEGATHYRVCADRVYYFKYINGVVYSDLYPDWKHYSSTYKNLDDIKPL